MANLFTWSDVAAPKESGYASEATRAFSAAGTVFGDLRKSLLDEEQRKWDRNFKEAQEAERIRQFNATNALNMDRLALDRQNFGLNQQKFDFDKEKFSKDYKLRSDTLAHTIKNDDRNYAINAFSKFSDAVEFSGGKSRISGSNGSSGNGNSGKDSTSVFNAPTKGGVQEWLESATRTQGAIPNYGNPNTASADLITENNRKAAIELRAKGRMADYFKPGVGKFFYDAADALDGSVQSASPKSSSEVTAPTSQTGSGYTEMTPPSTIAPAGVVGPTAAREEQLASVGTNAGVIPTPNTASTTENPSPSLSEARQEAVANQSPAPTKVEEQPKPLNASTSTSGNKASSDILEESKKINGNFAAGDFVKLAKGQGVSVVGPSNVPSEKLSGINTEVKHRLEIALHELQTDLGAFEKFALDIANKDTDELKARLKDPNILVAEKQIIETCLKDKSKLYTEAIKPLLETQYKGLRLPSSINSLAELNTTLKNYVVNHHLDTVVPIKIGNTHSLFKASISPSELKDSEQYTEAKKFEEERKKSERDRTEKSITEINSFNTNAAAAKKIIKEAAGMTDDRDLSIDTVYSARNIVKFLNETFGLEDKDTLPFFKKNSAHPRGQFTNWFGSDLEDGKVLLSILQDPEFEAKILGKSNNSEFKKDLLKYYRDVIKSENFDSTDGLEMDDKTFTYLTNTRPKDKPSLNDAIAARRDSTKLTTWRDIFDYPTAPLN